MNILLKWAKARAISTMLRNAVLLLGAVCVLGLPASYAKPKHSGPTIFVAAEIHARPSLPTPMPVLVGPPQSVPQGAYLLIRRVPPGTTFSEGQPLDHATWIVPIADSVRLKITLADGLSGTAELNLVLARYQGDESRGGILAQAKVKLIVGPPSGRESRPQKAARSGPTSRFLAVTRPLTPHRLAYRPVQTPPPRRDG